MGSLVDTEVVAMYSTELKVNVKFQIFVLCMHGVVECHFRNLYGFMKYFNRNFAHYLTIFLLIKGVSWCISSF